MGILIPLYTYPTDATWTTVRAQALANPLSNLTVIMNPNNGVGTSRDSAYAFGIHDLKQAGVTVLGYVATGYARRAMSAIIAECAQYAAWYDIDGIFFDEYQTGWQAPMVPGKISLGNPGTEATGNIQLVTYESAGMPPADFYGNYIAHTVAVLPVRYPKPSYYYITDDPATYQRLPTYFASLVSGDSLMSNTVAPGPVKTMTLTVDGKTYSWQVT